MMPSISSRNRERGIELTRLSGKQLETLCLLDASWSNDKSLYHMNRYGVQATVLPPSSPGNSPVINLISSLPDFEGVTEGGIQFIFDAKVCSSASFSLNDEKFKKRQLSHLLNRDRYGVTSFLLIHFNERKLKTKFMEAITYAFPVKNEHPFWEEVDRGEIKSIGRINCEEYGVEVAWHTPPKCKKARPNLHRAIMELRE